MKRKIHVDKKELQAILNDFIEKYGDTALLKALYSYAASQQFYICKRKNSMKRIPIHCIDYIEILGHTITIHTAEGDFTKYGTLKEEYSQLKDFGFVKCSQSFLVPIDKIAEIQGMTIILVTGDRFTLSRSCADEVIRAYAAQRPNRP